MMKSIHVCPRCHTNISEERRRQPLAICDGCGFVASGQEAKTGAALERRFLISALGISALLIAGFIQLVSWGSHSIEVIPLQIGQLLHSNSTNQLERLVQISFEMNKYDVTESAYGDLAAKEHTAYLRLGKFQMSRGKYAEAANSFRLYFSFNNEDLEAHYLYARALGETKQIDEAVKHFDYVLRARPSMRQITVVQNYVKALTQNGRFAQARKVIESERNRDRTALMFMDTEYKVILAQLHISG